MRGEADPRRVLVRKLLSLIPMRFDLAILTSIALCATGSVRAGEPVVSRQQFKESVTYPFIFKAEGYLASKGPLPMRFASAPPKCEQRQPPAPPVIAKKETPAEAPSADAKASLEPPPSVEAAGNATVEASSKKEPPDFSRVPDEVLDFFKNTEGRPVRRAYLFDPIFQPVTPDDLPKSKATSVQK